jgi:hypothetical protein
MGEALHYKYLNVKPMSKVCLIFNPHPGQLIFFVCWQKGVSVCGSTASLKSHFAEIILTFQGKTTLFTTQMQIEHTRTLMTQQLTEMGASLATVLPPVVNTDSEHLLK